MKYVKVICILLCVLYACVAITGINVIHYTTKSGLVVHGIDTHGRVYAIGGAFFFAGTAYAKTIVLNDSANYVLCPRNPE